MADEKYIRLQIADQVNKHIDHECCSLVFTKNQGVKGILCKTCNLFISMVFSKNKGWDEIKAIEFIKQFPAQVLETKILEDESQFIKMDFKSEAGDETAIQLMPVFKMTKEIEEQTLGKSFFTKEELVPRETTEDKPAEKSDEFKEELQICKLDVAKQIVYGAFLIPNKADHAGDVISSEDVEKVAHEFLTKYREIDEMHHKEKTEADIIESAIAWENGMKYYGKEIPIGTWFGAVKVYNKNIWEKIEAGIYKGFSVRITGKREEIIQ
jgi:hypothetical protein